MTAHAHRRGIAALSVAVGGVLAGHWLTYRLVAPSGHARASLLEGSGHGYLGYANDLALVLALTAMAGIFLGRLTHRGGAELGRRPLSIRLVSFQVAVFAAMEILERLTAGSSLTELLHHGVLPLGVGIQALVALGVALLIRALLRAADAAAALLGRRGQDRCGAVAPVPGAADHIVVRRVASSAVGLRGPPSLPVTG
jgi:hypothetical protein